MSKVLDRPTILPAVNVDAPDKDYLKLANKLGVKVAAVPTDLALREALHRLLLPVYNMTAVISYLKSKKPEMHWVIWQQLMARQSVSPTMISRFHRWIDEWTSQTRRHGSIRATGFYEKPVPYPVLLTVDTLIEDGKAHNYTPTFFVSDFTKAAERPKASLRHDPFLAVGTTESDVLFVIERWDEPGFREETYLSRQKKTPVIKSKSVR